VAFFGNAFLEISSETFNILSLRLFFRDHQNNVSMYFDCFEEEKNCAEYTYYKSSTSCLYFTTLHTGRYHLGFSTCTDPYRFLFSMHILHWRIGEYFDRLSNDSVFTNSSMFR